MAWVAVDRNGTEWVFGEEPERCPEERVGVLDVWATEATEGVTQLPFGIIEKLVGRQVDWEDEPIELIEKPDKA